MRVRLDGPRPPTFVHTPYPIAAHLGTSVELPCKAQGEPYPAIQWFKNGDPIELDQTHRYVMLTIKNIHFLYKKLQIIIYLNQGVSSWKSSYLQYYTI